MTSFFHTVGQMFGGGGGAAGEPAGPQRTATSSQRDRQQTRGTRLTSISSVVTYDADGNGKLDPLEQMLKDYDLDGNHRYSTPEVKAMVQAMLEHREGGQRYRRLAGVLAAVFVALIACIFGTAYLASDVTKETFLRSASNLLTDKNGRGVMFGANFVSVTQHDETRRRLRVVGGRQLVEVGDVDPSQVQGVIDAINNNVTSGTVMISKGGSSSRRQLQDLGTALSMATASGYLVAIEVIDGAVYYQVTKSGGGGPSYWITSSGTVLSQSPSRRLRRLDAADSYDHHRQRRLAERGNGTSPADWPPKCFVYHCFEGDPGCTEPSPRSLCAAWSADGAECLEPTCAFVDAGHAARHKARRRLETTSCTGDADCEANCYTEHYVVPKRKCDAGSCVECLANADCSTKAAHENADDDLLRGCVEGVCVQCTLDNHCDRWCEDSVTLIYTCNNDCFPAHATVTTPAGPKRMDALEPGERVLVDGGAAYSTVYLSAHEDRRAAVQHAFVRVELSSGHALELSPDHLARLAHGAYVRADDVRVGMAMSVVDSGGGSGAVSAVVTSVSEVQRAGLYAPITLHGDIVVDGVVASSYASILKAALPPPMRRSGTLLHALTHVLAAPARALHAAEPAVLAHIMKTARRTESGGFDLYALTGPGGLLAIKEAIDSGLAATAAPSVPRRALALAATYGGLMVVSTIAGVTNAVRSAASSATCLLAAVRLASQ